MLQLRTALGLSCLLVTTNAFQLLVLELGPPLGPLQDVGGDGNDTDADVSGGEMGGGKGRHRKQATSFDTESQQTIENKLNQLRRTVQASNMNYASWNKNLEDTASDLVQFCAIQHEAVVDEDMFPYVLGFTGVVRAPFLITGQLQSAYNLGASEGFYRQLMHSRMNQFACSIGQHMCQFTDDQSSPGHVQYGRIFACLFSYKSDPSQSVLYKSGTNCSSCDNETLWCDSGLCRGICPRTEETYCGVCGDACSQCDQVTSYIGTCRCVCYYGDSSQQRCSSDAYSSASQTICSSSPAYDDYYGRMPVGWIACVIVSSALLLSLSISVAIWHCVRRRNLARRLREGATRSTNRQENSNQAFDEFGPGFVPVMSPPPYIEATIKPPPYEPEPFGTQQGDKSEEQPSKQESTEPSAPDYATVVGLTSGSHVYENAACNADECQI